MPAPPVAYVSRNARGSPLWQVVHEYLPKLVDYVGRRDQHVPAFVEAELEAFLACGQLENGFTHIRCKTCDARELVPFTCKSRALCPTCCGRRMNQTAKHLVDEVFPHVPTRQWVLTFPAPLRYLLAYDTELCTRALALFVEQIVAHYRFTLAREHDVDVRSLAGGSVTSIQRAGSALQATLHFHTVALDGVYLVTNDEPPRFLAAPRVSAVEVQAVAWNTCQAVTKMLQRRGVELTGEDDDLDKLHNEHPLLARSLAASQMGVVALGDDAGRRLARTGWAVQQHADVEAKGSQQTPGHGFNLHAGLRVPACDRKRLERLCRYILSPPVSANRISTTADGRIAYRLKRPWSDGTQVVYFSGLDFMSKLMALIPRPRVHLIRYHGCLAPRSKLRRQVVPGRTKRRASAAAPAGGQMQLLDQADGSSRWIPRRELLAHVFGDDAARCRRCGSSRLEVVAVVKRWEAIRSVLTSLGLDPDGGVLSRNRGPPGQLELGFGETARERAAA